MAGPPITTWPNGGANQYTSPFDRTPMFAGDLGPRYTGPMNIGGQYGGILQMLGPALMQPLMGNRYMPGQFFPQQNVYDQMEATKFYNASQQAMAIASRRDAGAIENTIGGITQMMTGQPLSGFQRARNHRIATGVTKFMPMLTQVLGPDMVDQLHGSRGSATVFAQQMHQALRTSIDPVSGRVGYSGESAGRLTQEAFERMFGGNADFGMLRGMSAGQAGVLANELQARGMLGTPLGAMPLQERRSMLSKTLSNDVVNRLAEQLPEVQGILSKGGTPNEDVLKRARESIRATNNQLTDPRVQLTQQDIAKLPGAEEIIRAGDADRIKQRLTNLSGAIKAMRDIFGDMGNPNAPMRELVNGLEALTQGGMATMSPGDLEMMVRKTHTIAKQTGVGVEGMMALTTQNAALADRLGLDRQYAVMAAQQAAGFGAAAGDRLRLDIPAWGASTKEQLTLGDQQMRMHAAASPLANQLNALMRMVDTGMAQPGEKTELSALVKAIQQGQSNYTFNGQTQDIIMPHSQMLRMLERDAGVNRTRAYSILHDTTGNQEFGLRHNTTGTVRRAQTDETARRMLTPTVSNRIRGMLADDDINTLLEAEGITQSDADFRRMMHQVGEGVSKDFFALSGKTVRNQGEKQKALGQAFRNRFTEAVRQRMPNAKPAEIDAIVSNMITQMGGEQGMESMGTAIGATINDTARNNPILKSDVTMHNMMSQEAMAQQEARDRQAEITALTQSAMSGLGTADPVRRLADVFQNAGPDTKLQDALAQALGGVSQDAINAADPNGDLAKVFGLIKENNALDANDPAQLVQARRNAAIVKGLIEGGTMAEEQIRMLDASRKQITAAEATREQRASALEALDTAELRERQPRDARLRTAQNRMDATQERLEKLASGALGEKESAEERRSITNAVRGMAAGLGKDEIALGGGRVLTRNGIVTRDADGRVIRQTGFENIDTAREAFGALKERHAETLDAAAKSDAAAKNRTEAERLKLAEERGLIRGDLTIGNEDVRERLVRASKRGSDTNILGDLGYQLGATTSIDQVKATTDSGELAAKLLKEGKLTDESKSAISTFVTGAKERAQQLLGDERSMKIMGRGSLELVQGAAKQSDELQALAAAVSKKLGREVDVGELMLGGKGIDSATQKKAKALFDQSRKQWAEIDRLRSFGMLPGKGDDPANKRRAGMSEQEIEDWQAQQDFAKQFATADERAGNVLDRMMAIATPEQRARMNVDTNKKQLLQAIAEGDRGIALDKALRSRNELLEMGLRKKVFGDKTKVSELTDKEESSILDRLKNADLSEEERVDFERLRKSGSMLLDYGMQNMKPENIMQDTLRKVRSAATTQAPQQQDKQDQNIKVTVNGTVTQRSDGLADLSLEGRGLMDRVTNATGMV